MTNPRTHRVHDAARNPLGPLDGARIPGGCDYCDAYQTVEPVAAGTWLLRVRHDDWCAWLAAHEERT